MEVKMRGKVAILTLMVLMAGLLMISISACSSSQAAGPVVKPTWIKPEVAGETVSISLSEVEKDVNTHFKISNPTMNLAYMAYKYDGQLYIRADICPPCRSESFTLKGDTLVCDTCGTVFDARTGAGKIGACVAYPKALVAYQIQDGNITMKGTDLVTAFQNTLRPGK
jgi:nitrite reductase/ring-hydroxylating ferredoxin subunit